MMSEMPLEPQLAKMLLISPEFHCSNEVGILLPHPFLVRRIFLYEDSLLLFEHHSTVPVSAPPSSSFSCNPLLRFFSLPLYSPLPPDVVHSSDALFCFHLHAAQRSCQSGE
jgi:Helicase associated domain (HA2)